MLNLQGEARVLFFTPTGKVIHLKSHMVSVDGSTVTLYATGKKAEDEAKGSSRITLPVGSCVVFWGESDTPAEDLIADFS